ncbi:MAG: nuclear transport factor 2 family protein [Burkholderiaceae bacterium]|uniref:YybH family protein n=1 Tax=Ottowia sp. TaxID=1898956 RepID=UPI001E01929C|nr:nuclear transport factor 2 family protein [Ottowia sp.]MCB2036851.1 nuclear transport factor 2 family protein [Ottowia sp.]HPR43571.1 nuclear transport factor 2 family protein [Ottowia sp.]
MPKTPYRTAAPPGATADDVEAAFYEALQAADLDQLMACWADDDEIVCVLPGGPRVTGAPAIRAAFERMFSLGAIRAEPQRVRKIETMTTSVHSVIERVEITLSEGPHQSWVVATNVYLKTAQGWRLAAHHASPGTQQRAEVTEHGRLLH